MAAEMDFEFMQPTWEVIQANLAHEPSLPQLAARVGGEIDRIEDRNAVVLPSDAYIVQFGKYVMATMRPGNRKNVARWISKMDSNSSSLLSPYLNDAVRFADKGTPVIMALDLEDVISPDLAKERLKSFDSLKDTKLNIDQVSAALSSIRGVTLGITIKNRVFGAIKVDFQEDVSFLKAVAKPLLLEALSRHSAMIDEFEEWDAVVQGKQIKIQGYLNPGGRRRIMSLLDAPPELRDAIQRAEKETSASSPSASTDSIKRLASQQYFRTVNDLIEDLRTKPETTAVKSFGQVGKWFGSYARKIDQLPMLNVDPELLSFGAFVSTSFRDAEASLRGSGGRSRVAQQNASASYGYYSGGRYGAYGAYARGEASAEQAARTRVRTEERVSTSTDARQIMLEIADASRDIRQKMTQKYQAEF
jgi:hypothetical protein